MKKSAYLLLFLFICLPAIHAQDENKYLAGAVPEIDGKVVFLQEFSIPNATQDDVFDRTLAWLESRMAKNGNQSRVVYNDKEKGKIAALAEEYIVFSSSALSLDRTLFSYQVTVTALPAKCIIEIEKLRYNYQEKERYTAEEWITDQHALNKNKTKLVRGISKFRIKTIDFVDKFFADAQLSLNAIPEESNSLVAVSTPTTFTQVTSRPSAVSGSLSGYKQIDPDKIPGNIIKLLGENWMLITAGNDEKFNMMTASWGGIGRLYEKPVAMCFINPMRYTYQLMETHDTYTLTFYTEAYREALQYNGNNSGRDGDKVAGSGLTPITTPSGSKAFSEAWLIIECRKLVSQSLNHDAIADDALRNEWTGKQLHKMYIGEIISVWVK